MAWNEPLIPPDDCPHIGRGITPIFRADIGAMDSRCRGCGLLIARTRAVPNGETAWVEEGPWMPPGPNQYRDRKI
jgi:hypothetical protein